MAEVLKEEQGKVLIYGNKAIKNPEPTKSWFYVTEYNSDGYPIKAKTIGCSGDMPYELMYGSDDTRYLNILSRTLEDFEINEGVTNVGKFAFWYCYKLKNVTIPKSVTQISKYGFSYCSRLTSISSLNATAIREYAFKSSKSLTNISFPKVTSLEHYAFADCDSLTNISFPEVRSIGAFAFSWCIGLTSLTIPNVTSIGASAFHYCSSLALIDFRGATQVPTLSSTNVFQSTPSTKKIVVPDSLYDEWITATNWSSTTNNIVSSIIKASDYEASL